MARVSELSRAAILDTSWLLELYRVPGHFTQSRTQRVRTETAELVDARCELFVTVPALFEFANHICHVGDGRRRRALAERLRDDVRNSLERESPWTVASFGSDILRRSQDVIELADGFLAHSGTGYSFADISIIELAVELEVSRKTVSIKTFDEQL